MQEEPGDADAYSPNGGPVYQSINDADLDDDSQAEKQQNYPSPVFNDGSLNDVRCLCTNHLKTLSSSLELASDSKETEVAVCNITSVKNPADTSNSARKSSLREVKNWAKAHSLAKLTGIVSRRKSGSSSNETDLKQPFTCPSSDLHTSSEHLGERTVRFGRGSDVRTHGVRTTGAVGGGTLLKFFGCVSSHASERDDEHSWAQSDSVRYSLAALNTRNAACRRGAEQKGDVNHNHNHNSHAHAHVAIELPNPRDCTSEAMHCFAPSPTTSNPHKRLVTPTDYPLQRVGAGNASAGQTSVDTAASATATSALDPASSHSRSRTVETENVPGDPKLNHASTSSSSNGPARLPATDTQQLPSATASNCDEGHGTTMYTRIDYRHHLVGDLQSIFALPFYFGTVDRYAAEAILADRPDGSFLLRDSAQSDYLFSVSFRRFERTLHARIEIMIVHEPEQLSSAASSRRASAAEQISRLTDAVSLLYTFDAYERTSVCAPSVGELLKQYNVIRPMYFEPSLTAPVNRPHVFSLKQLCRAAVCSAAADYDRIAELPLPASIKAYLREYHHKEPISLHQFEVPMPPRNGKKHSKPHSEAK